MTKHTAPAPASIADTPMIGDEIATDLASLMERLERVRKFLHVEREYTKLVLIGGWFILVGAILTPGFPWRAFLVLGFAATPWLFGWYNLPKVRLANAFRNETLPFFLRDYGRWNYALTGTHFSRDHLRRTGTINPTDVISLGNIMTGERFGVPLQMAVLSSWPKQRFGIYRGAKANFSGWAASIRLPDLLQEQHLVLPNGQKPANPAYLDWESAALTPSHQIFSPKGTSNTLPQPVLARLLGSMMEEPKASYALRDGVLWIMVPSNDTRFNQVTDLTTALNEPAPYESARKELADMFRVIDRIVWPVA